MIRKLTTHAVLILAELFIVLNILDSYNPAMNFLTNGFSKALLFVFCAAAAACSILQFVSNRRGIQ
jgi:hypothetical protein